MRILGIDHGIARIGLALSDPTGTIASPYEVLEEKDRGAQINRVVAIARELEVERIVVGIPYEMDGNAGEMAQWAEKYATKLEAVSGIPVSRWDERLTSVQAERSMKVSGKRGRKGKTLKGNVDKVAAAIILQAYLDSMP